MNPLETFNGTLTGLFPSLSTLDATGIKDWKPEKQFLQLRMLKRIRGLRWSAECSFCSFLERGIMNKSWLQRTRIIYFRCYEYRYTLKNSSLLAKLLPNTSFDFRCKNSWRCLRRSGDFGVSIQIYCWKEVLIAVRIQGVLGFVAIITNFVVFLNILTSKLLRKNVSMVFLCNMAASDLILGVYSLRIAVYFSSKSPAEIFNEGRDNCWKIGFLWMLGQTVAVLTSFLLTLERYFVLIFVLRPNVRISGRCAVILIVITWFIAIFLTGYALAFNMYLYTFLCIPVRLDSKFVNVFAFTLVNATLALFLYLISSAMYFHIYIKTKRTSQSAGIKRESRIAKKIAVLVFSNILFFMFPVVLAGVLHIWVSSFERYMSESFLYIVTTFFPSLSLNVNSCLNPFLYAFRNDRFLQALRQRLVYVGGHIRSALPPQNRAKTVHSRIAPVVRFVAQTNNGNVPIKE